MPADTLITHAPTPTVRRQKPQLDTSLGCNATQHPDRGGGQNRARNRGRTNQRFTEPGKGGKTKTGVGNQVGHAARLGQRWSMVLTQKQRHDM